MELIEEKRFDVIARSLIRWVGSIALGSLALLSYDLTLRAFAPGYAGATPTWIPVLLSSGAIVGPVTCFTAAVKGGLLSRRK